MFHDEMLTIEELARFLKLKRQTIYKWAQCGKIPGAKFGKEWRFRRSAIEKWIDQHMEVAPGGASSNGKHPARGRRALAGAGKPARSDAPARGGRGRATSSGKKATAKANVQGADGEAPPRRRSSATRN